MTDSLLAELIRRYWRNRGADVAVEIVPIKWVQNSMMHGIRSNLKNGLPKGWRYER